MLLRALVAVALMFSFADAVPACARKDKHHQHAAVPTYQITASQSGGIAGMHKEISIDSAKLRKPQQKHLDELVQATGILKVDSEKKVTPRAADMFFYEFKVTSEGKTHTATFDEGTLPQTYRDLREYLNEVQPKKK
jgi:hypothetical protein